MHNLLRKYYKESAADTPNIDSAGAVAEFAWPHPVIVTRVGVIATTAVDTDNSVALTATLSRRPVRGSSSNAVTLGVFTMAPANNTAQLPAGAMVYKDLAILDHDGETAEDGNLRNVAPNKGALSPYGVSGQIDYENMFLILPGQAFAMTLDTNAEADSGAVVSFVEYIQLPFSGRHIGAATVHRDTSND